MQKVRLAVSECQQRFLSAHVLVLNRQREEVFQCLTKHTVALMVQTALVTAGELLHLAEPFLDRKLHPTVIIKGFTMALEDALQAVEDIAFPIDMKNSKDVLNVVQSCLQTKFTSQFGTLMAVSIPLGDGMNSHCGVRPSVHTCLQDHCMCI